METIEDLKRRIESTEDLQSVVKTMKAMAAVKIRQYEKAVESLADYNKTVEMGLQIALRNRSDVMVEARSSQEGTLGAVIFGSDQGMCGQLNDQIVSFALDHMTSLLSDRKGPTLVMAIGERTRGRLEDAGQHVTEFFPLPGSVTGIVSKVQAVLTVIQAWSEEQNLGRLYLFYSRPLSGSRYEPHSVHLLPLDREWLENLRARGWPNRTLPRFTMDWDPLFSALIRQYLFVALFRAFAESLASENASRLAAMQGAEKNIEENLAGLNRQFHQKRQMTITEELLDIVSGFEALENKANV
jgi:F-type H+-transporting ATPase subunit gamma